MAPELMDITCEPEGICVEQAADLQRARQLYKPALADVRRRVGDPGPAPRVIFCASERCAKNFGLGKRSAVTFGSWGSAISPRAWQPHYVRHEMIHQLQAQQLGLLKCLLLPSWLIEGMAYELSDDPRNPLDPPWQNYRQQFQQWQSGFVPSELWQQINAL